MVRGRCFATHLTTALATLAILLTILTVTQPVSAHGIPEELKQATIEALIRYDEKGGDIEVSAIYAIDEYWHLLNLNPDEYGLDQDNNHIFLLILNIHVGDLPGHGSPYPRWEKITELKINDDKGIPPTLAKLLVDSPHHMVIALQFTKKDSAGIITVPSGSAKMELLIRGLESQSDTKLMRWYLPLTLSKEVADAMRPKTPIIGSLGAFLPLIGGMLVYFSPCFMELSAVYIGLISGIKASELSEKKNHRKFRLKILTSAILFIAGFTSIYTAAGAVAGYSGQIMQGSIFEDIAFPLRIIGGSMLIYIGLQSSGLPSIFGLRSFFPFFPKVNASCRTGGSFIVGLTFGCLQCFRGSLVVAMLFFAWTIGSAQMGALILFILSLSFGIPFLLIGVLVGRTSFLEDRAPRIAKYAAVATSIFLVVLGVLTILYDQHPLLDPIDELLKTLTGIRS